MRCTDNSVQGVHFLLLTMPFHLNTGKTSPLLLLRAVLYCQWCCTKTATWTSRCTGSLIIGLATRCNILALSAGGLATGLAAAALATICPLVDKLYTVAALPYPIGKSIHGRPPSISGDHIRRPSQETIPGDVITTTQSTTIAPQRSTTATIHTGTWY